MFFSSVLTSKRVLQLCVLLRAQHSTSQPIGGAPQHCNRYMILVDVTAPVLTITITRPHPRSIPRRRADATLTPERHAAGARGCTECARTHPHNQRKTLSRSDIRHLVQVLPEVQDSAASAGHNVSLQLPLPGTTSQPLKSQHAALELTAQADVESHFAVVSVRDKGGPGQQRGGIG